VLLQAWTGGGEAWSDAGSSPIGHRLKQWRGVATRFEKRAVYYRAAVVVVALVIWLEG
jgi:hypothetical protein